MVKIFNLYMQGTIEEDAYYTLRHRIGAFEEVIGPCSLSLLRCPVSSGDWRVARSNWPRRTDFLMRPPGHNPMLLSLRWRRVCRKSMTPCRWIVMSHRQSHRANSPPGALHTPLQVCGSSWCLNLGPILPSKTEPRAAWRSPGRILPRTWVLLPRQRSWSPFMERSRTATRQRLLEKASRGWQSKAKQGFGS